MIYCQWCFYTNVCFTIDPLNVHIVQPRQTKILQFCRFLVYFPTDKPAFWLSPDIYVYSDWLDLLK